MKKTILFLAVLLCLTVSLAGASPAGASPKAGDSFPKMAIPLPQSRAHMDYLGLQRGQTFELAQVKADVVILEVLSMYCPYCQAEAPKVNRLFEMIEEDPRLKGRVKIVGIAAGNTPLETELFQKKYDVPFPLFSDGDFTFHRILGEVRTPYFIGVRLEKGTARVFYSRLGAFEDPEAFLSLMLEGAGLSDPPEVGR